MANGQVRLALARDVTEVRHFRGLDDEILREMRLIPSSKLPVVEKLKDHKVLLTKLRFATTVVYGVEDIRLFNGDNHEIARFSFPHHFLTRKENEERLIAENHDIRMEVIQALTDGKSTVATVSFIPGGVEHIRLTADDLSKRWQDELDTFCAALVSLACRNSYLRHVHFETKLCTGWSPNIDHLLQSSLEEISLPNLNEKWWRDFAAKLARNQTLRVVTVPYGRRRMNAFLPAPSSIRQGVPISASWTTCNQTMTTLCITLPVNFRADVQADAEAMATTLCRARSVSIIVIEYTPSEQPPELHTFAKCLRQALVWAPHVSVLHLLVPFRGEDLRELMLPVRELTGLILVSDLWKKKDLKAAKNLIRDSPKLEVFGLRRQNPKRELNLMPSFLSQEITTADIAMFLRYDRVDETRLRTLSLRGWDQVDGEKVLAALDDRLEAQPNLYIDLTGTGLLLKKRRAAHAVSEVGSESGRSTTTEFSFSHTSSHAGNNGSVYLSAMSRKSGMAPSTGASTNGSSFYYRRNQIEEHNEFGSHMHAGPGSVCSETPEHHQLQQQQQYSGPQQGRSMHFSNFSYDQLQEATGNFDPGAVIGRGGFGQVQSNWRMQ